ncbi:MAG: hypothetical protein JJ975_01035, partial [Bacteroidia bacterium]|nr:hypothetical protein [Bacteroidia bacterium]
MNFNILGYSLFLSTTIYVTVVVGYAFYKNGYFLILSLFGNNQEAATALNRLLLIAYYLVNIGYMAFSIHTWPTLPSMAEMCAVLFQRVGTILLVLAGLHV